MQTITRLKQLTGLNAEQMAHLLGLNRSQITMAVGGHRSLPKVAVEKMNHLLEIAESVAAKESKPPFAAHSREHIERHARKLELHAKQCRYKMQGIDRKLEKIGRQQETCQLLLATLQAWRDTREQADEDDLLRVNYMLAQLNQKLRKAGKQDLLLMQWQRAQLETLAAAAEKHAKNIRNNFKKKHPGAGMERR